MKYNQELPAEIEAQLDSYIERIKAIKWFQPATTLKKEDIEKHVNITLKAFGVEAGIEYRQLKKPEDWDAAWGVARDVARDVARGAARDVARGVARDAAWGVARGAAWDAAWGADDLLVSDLQGYKEKYPNGSFLNLIPLYEMGLWPIGVVDGKFIVAIPASKLEFPDIV